MELAMGQGTCRAGEVNAGRVSVCLFSSCKHHEASIMEHPSHMVVTNTYMHFCTESDIHEMYQQTKWHVGFLLLLLLVSLRG